jgi:glycosyltransferase involved in cell wall biosynthesis
MHLLLITRYYPPDIDGVGDHSFFLKEHLGALGWQVSVWSQHEGPFGREMTATILESIHRQRITHVLWQYVPNSYHRHGKPGWLPKALQQVAATGVRQAVFFHEVALRTRGFGWRQAIKGRRQLYIARQMRKQAQVAFTSIPLYAGYFKERPPQLVSISPNIRVENSPLDPEKRHWLRPTFFFCFSNRLCEAQMQALQQVKKGYNIRILLAGKTDQAQAERIVKWTLEYDLKDRVVLHGTLPAAELAHLLQQCDAVLQYEPVYARGEGGISAKNGTLAAAWAAGKPVLTTRGDMTDPAIFVDGQNCLFVNASDDKGWAEAMERFLAMSTAAKEEMNKAIAHTFATHFSWEVTARKVHEGLLG